MSPTVPPSSIRQIRGFVVVSVVDVVVSVVGVVVVRVGVVVSEVEVRPLGTERIQFWIASVT